MTTKLENDPWSDGLFKSTVSAQKAFDSSNYFDDKQVSWSAEYHHNVSSSVDRDRVKTLIGDESQILAWYWDDAYRAV